jgi:hypothetical protein
VVRLRVVAATVVLPAVRLRADSAALLRVADTADSSRASARRVASLLRAVR